MFDDVTYLHAVDAVQEGQHVVVHLVVGHACKNWAGKGSAHVR